MGAAAGRAVAREVAVNAVARVGICIVVVDDDCDGVIDF